MSAQDKLVVYLKNPFICGLIFGVLTYYIYSSNYITRSNIKEKYPLKRQRTSNIKASFYVFLVATLVLFLFRYALFDSDESTGGSMLGGHPPF